MPDTRGPRRWRRRAFLGELGRGTLAFAILTPAVVAACTDDGGDDAGAPAGATGSTGPDAETTITATQRPTTTGPADEPPTNSTDTALTWARADLGFVSAYVLARGNEAAVVDTGVAGSADDIGTTLADIGLDYAAVRHVILTHLHPDHAGSISDVMGQAEAATAYAGPADIGGIDFDSIRAADDGADVFGLEVIATPGHTDGHISVIDHEAGILVAGDAVNAVDGGVQGPNPDFSVDIEAANESARRLAELSFNTLLTGHGDPIEDMADTAVAAMAAALS